LRLRLCQHRTWTGLGMASSRRWRWRGVSLEHPGSYCPAEPPTAYLGVRSPSEVAPQGGFLCRIHVSLTPGTERSMGRLRRFPRLNTAHTSVPRPASHAERQVLRHNVPRSHFWPPRCRDGQRDSLGSLSRNRREWRRTRPRPRVAQLGWPPPESALNALLNTRTRSCGFLVAFVCRRA
jgi:hypothetical protein